MSAQTVFIVSGDGIVHALDLVSGRELWSVALGAQVGAATPLLIDGQLVVGDTNGKLHALDMNDGAEAWAYEADGAITGAAASISNVIIAATIAGTAFALSLTGKEIWQTTLAHGVSRSIAASGNLAYFGSGGDLVALRVDDGSMVWQARLAANGEGGTPTVSDGLVFAATGISTADLESKGVAALDAATGDIAWRYTSPDKAQVYTPAVIGSRAYVVGQDATVVALDAASGTRLWSTSTAGPNSALPAVAEGVVYIAGNEGEVAALDWATGQFLWSAQLIEGKPYSPVVIDGFFLIGTSRGILYALADGLAK